MDEFIKEYVALCQKHGFFVGYVTYGRDGDNSEIKRITPGSFAFQDHLLSIVGHGGLEHYGFKETK
jgi:hypothetical protein